VYTYFYIYVYVAGIHLFCQYLRAFLLLRFYLISCGWQICFFLVCRE